MFSARIEIIGVNPFVHLPAAALRHLFLQAKKFRGPIPIRATIDGHSFPQTLVKYAGHWRFYVNGPMLKAAGKNVGDIIMLALAFDPSDRTVPLHPKFAAALRRNAGAKRMFARLSPYRRKEIARYLGALKSDAAVKRNIERVIGFLTGQNRFAGRDR
ncbi:MAG TPA: YdeI/OmpD-associated family protein [Candidatus Didemnitutus sp.]